MKELKINEMMEQVTRLFDILELYKTTYASKEDALCKKKGGEWIKTSSLEYVHNSHKVAAWLYSMGIRKGDKIATILSNSPQWNMIDMGAAIIGAIHVPIYTTLNLSEVEYILDHSDAKILFINDKSIYRKYSSVFINNLAIKKTVSINDTIENTYQWDELMHHSEGLYNTLKDQIELEKASITSDDLLSIIYTSGTTGTPKGVMLSHHNILSNTKGAARLFQNGERGMGMNHRALSFLPLSHVYERMVTYTFQFSGLSLYYIENLGSLVTDIKTIKPHIFNTVPRLLEKIYDKVFSVGDDLKGIKKVLFDKAVEFTNKYEIGIKYSFLDKIQFHIYDALIYKKWREILGGELYYMVSGGSALQLKIHKFFWTAKLRVYEGYGLTETSPVVFVNNPMDDDFVKLGTVGPVIDNGTKFMLADDGEILVKGPGVMQGYFKNKEQTDEVIDSDGWFHTGDIGTLVEDRFMKITDRKKEIFKLSAGKYVAPQAVENILKGSLFIEQAFVVGENQKVAGAIIKPDFSYIKQWCLKSGISFTTEEEIIKDAIVEKAIRKDIASLNTKLSAHEQVKKIDLVCEEWNPSNGLLSATLKLKRKHLKEKYKSHIEKMYQ
ncbi:long-chain fatty acid--CoA ligase [Halosquirtibacter xylanolyticus]|uniref:AMP-dependent synthetase/ligase n=1 Tax=Halosquirtibacter xylanolyticus TaxID=3374599 RepID=UPI0037481972|nr:long-chain fatty acid--CoA ligase [Prolixibacteraceae bacterium]